MENEHEVEVVGHQATRKHAHRAAFLGGVEERQECFVVRFLVKDALPAVSPIENVVTVSTHSNPSSSRHDRRGYPAVQLLPI
jgi:hypothetical protein